MGQSGKPALEGVRILDFSRIIAGPLCTQQLSDMGAEVIKIEHPEIGDEARRLLEPGVAGQSHFFLAYNRNKRSVGLDIRQPAGQAVVHALLEKSDVVVENFRVGVMRRFGLDYDTLQARYPHLIYLSISAYGAHGPMSDRPGFDPVLQAESGMMSLTGDPDGPPCRHPLSIIDTLTALQAAGAVCAALYARRDTGRGQHIDLALMDTAIAALGNAGLYYLCSGASPPRTGNSHMTATPTNLFETKTGPIYLAIPTDRLFGRFCREVLERPELADDPRYRTSEDRLTHRPELYALLREIFASNSREHWLAKMRHLPAGSVRTLAESLESEEVAAREMVTTVPHPSGEELRLLGSPLKFSDTPVRQFQPPPRLGEHTEEVLRSLAGYDDAKLAALRAKGVIR